MTVLHISCDVSVTDAEAVLLQDMLGCQSGELEKEVGRYSVAAIREYLDMFLGASLTTLTDVRERRLVNLILTAFSGHTPDADLVAKLFNITPTAARGLLRSVAAKHRLRLKPALHETLVGVLDKCRRPGKAGPYSLVETNQVLIELLNDRLAASPKPMVKIKPQGDGMTTYEVTSDSYDHLRTVV